MEPKLITSKTEYEQSLAEVERLVALDPVPESTDGERLRLLAMLVETYEKEQFVFEKPDPIEAILFRMEEQGLKQADLIPYIGSKSKVSEILSRKRPLTLSMIRALHSGLGIPAEVLLQEKSTAEQPTLLADLSSAPDWKLFPLKEMFNRGWISGKASDLQVRGSDLLREFFAPLHGQLPQALWRRRVGESENGSEQFALTAWTARVLIRAQSLPWDEPYKPGTVTKEFLNEVVRLSWSDQGPLLVQEFLAKHGIALIIEPHLSKTKLDGGAMLTNDGRPVIGMTLRYDRLDHFWFTLIHELIHVQKHLKSPREAFFDDLESDVSDDPREKEADLNCKEALIPRSRWVRSEAFRQRTIATVTQFAKELKIHPAIVAGRLRYEAKDFSMLNELVGNGKVRKLFPETSELK